MRPSIVRQRLQTGKTILNAWLSIGSTYSAEGVGHSGVHTVTVDLQHGMLDFSNLLPMLQAISSTPAMPMARVTALQPAEITKVLDAGAYGVICPMISTPEQAAELVSICRYPPLGKRSFGPSRGLLYGGDDYVAHANETIMVIPMIETAEAIERIEEILDVPGIDMIYIGPNDLAFDIDGDVRPPRTQSEAAIVRVLEAAGRRKIPTGIFCASVQEAQARIDQGFNLVTPSNDFSHLMRGMRDAVATLSQENPKTNASKEVHVNGY